MIKGGLLQIFAISQFRVFVCVTYSIINRFFMILPFLNTVFWSPAISTYFGPRPYQHILVPGHIDIFWSQAISTYFGPRPYQHILVPGHINIFWSPAISTYFGPGPYRHILVLGHIEIFWSPAISTYFEKKNIFASTSDFFFTET